MPKVETSIRFSIHSLPPLGVGPFRCSRARASCNEAGDRDTQPHAGPDASAERQWSPGAPLWFHAVRSQ